VHVWLDIASFGACLAATLVGLVLSVIAWRRLGARSGMRGVAWSLLPIVAYLTGTLRLVGGFVASIVHFSSSFVFSTKTWAGVVLAGVAVLFFLVSGGMPWLHWGKRSRERKAKANRAAATAGSQVATTSTGGRKAVQQPAKGADDGLDSDVEDILRRRGIK
jgi:cytochrome c oxidase assembly factor CtaG